MKKDSLADKIASILTTVPSNIDPEDENVDNSNATVYENAGNSDEDLPIQSQIRKQNIDYLADVDERYAGAEGSRKSLISEEEISSNGDGDSDEEDESDESNNESEVQSENEDSENSHLDQELVDSSDQEDDQTKFKTLKPDASTQIKKGRCVKNQMSIWENLLELRIQVQKCMAAANKMPRPEKYKEIKNESGQELLTSVQQTKTSISSVLEKMLLLQSLFWKQFPEMKHKSKQSEDLDNEEIPSDTEDEANEEEDDEDKPSSAKKTKLSDFEQEIQTKFDVYKGFRNSVIQKWHDKTRLPVMKSNTPAHSIIDHIEHTLADRDKLIKRTRLKRTAYVIVGEETDENDNSGNNETDKEEYNSEIFDDNDFYHHLLRELIEVKSADLTDPVQLGRQWMQLQSLRSKMKRKIDTKATKGRKIRYAVHTKLVNFMAPIDTNTWPDKAKNDLFCSLFGKNQTGIS